MSPMVAVLNAVFSAFFWCVRMAFYLIVRPFCRWYCRKLSEGWQDVQQRRTDGKAAKQFRPNRRQRRRIASAAVGTDMPDPELIYRALWWCLYVMAKEVPATTMANHMAHTKPDFHQAVAYVAGQIYVMPVRFPTEIEPMVWATEIKALHGVDQRLPQVEDF